jgi:hypothetical protein
MKGYPKSNLTQWFLVASLGKRFLLIIPGENNKRDVLFVPGDLFQHKAA